MLRRLGLTCACDVSEEEIKILSLSLFLTPQWKYDHMSATYLLLLSKKARGKRVRLRFPRPTENASATMSTGLEVNLSSATCLKSCSALTKFCLEKHPVALNIRKRACS